MTINCKGQLVDLQQTKVMGILNVTPDSFFDGDQYNTSRAILKQVEKMLTEGATFIDVGGYSSRPGAKDVSLDNELTRVIPVIELLIKEFPDILISIDTFRASVAKESVDCGACMINDISAGKLDADMFRTVADLQVPYILMHMKGTPQNMQDNPQYDNIIVEINQYFSQKVDRLRSLGVNDIILDPGFGFAKTIDHNYQLLSGYQAIGDGSTATLIGISRKSMIYKKLNITPEQALNGTSVLHAVALQKGANILRVHDVKQAVECIEIIRALKQASIASN